MNRRAGPRDVRHPARARTQGSFTLLDQKRVPQPHAQFRLFATMNTLGQGNLQRPVPRHADLNHAQLDRWNLVTSLDYLAPAGRPPSCWRACRSWPRRRARAGGCHGGAGCAHAQGFAVGDRALLMSPRTVITWAENARVFHDLRLAFELSFLNKCEPAGAGHRGRVLPALLRPGTGAGDEPAHACWGILAGAHGGLGRGAAAPPGGRCLAAMERADAIPGHGARGAGSGHQSDVPARLADQRGLLGTAPACACAPKRCRAARAPPARRSRGAAGVRTAGAVARGKPGARGMAPAHAPGPACALCALEPGPFSDSGPAESSLGILLFTVALTAWSRLSGHEPPDALGDLAEATRAGLSAQLGAQWSLLRRHRQDQQAFIARGPGHQPLGGPAVRAAQEEAPRGAAGPRRRAFALPLHFESQSLDAPPVALSGDSRAWAGWPTAKPPVHAPTARRRRPS
ncbi:Mucin-19 [Manis javanica]|nr:Mucin-19 [Manis javanica]